MDYRTLNLKVSLTKSLLPLPTSRGKTPLSRSSVTVRYVFFIGVNCELCILSIYHSLLIVVYLSSLIKVDCVGMGKLCFCFTVRHCLAGKKYVVLYFALVFIVLNHSSCFPAKSKRKT